jgi:amylosucrase
MLSSRLKEFMPELVSRFYQLYGSRWDFDQMLQKLTIVIKEAAEKRSDELKKQDEDREKKPDWFLDQKETGIMLYVDLYAKDLSGLKRKISALEDLGITYVHLMPLFRSPSLHNDGGYAVSSYREVEKKLGTIEQLAEVASLFRKKGIHLVLDFVFNHTSDEHEWALAAKKGNAEFREYYIIFEDKAEADRWNSTLREIFPDTRRGSFTLVEDAGGWVWTTFNSFQWDLDYRNPKVFISMCEEMLAIANIGVDVLRLDALAFVWKKLGTTCENLPEAHILIQAFQFVARIAAPSLIFKSEAIVHPDEVIKYIGSNECRLSYNPLQMALFWESTATRQTRLLAHSLRKRWTIPESCGWVNYIRCHDDIGWTFSDEDARDVGISGYDHRHFLNRFYTNRFEGSFARGEVFQYNPANGDCRVCGTMASLAGLEEANEMHGKAENSSGREHADFYADMAVRRMNLLYALLLALPGMPLLYAGDETATLNDYSYRNNPGKKADSRWVHRSATDWNKTERIVSGKTGESWLEDRQARVYSALKKAIQIRRGEPLFGKAGVEFYEEKNEHILAFSRYSAGKGKILVAGNFSEKPVVLTFGKKLTGIDLLSGRRFLGAELCILESYQTVWIKEQVSEFSEGNKK